MITISIIIINYKVKEYIIPCVESIYKKSPTNKKYSFEIIIVDNNSRDGIIKIINKKFPEIYTKQNEKNIGFSRAVNQGAKIANGNFLLILNPDTLFVEDSLTKLISFVEKQNNIGAVGPRLTNQYGIIQQSVWEKPTLLNTILSIYHLEYINNKKNYSKKNKEKALPVDTISGGALFISSMIFHSLNGFNSDLFWMEDIDLCVRIKELGYNNYYFPETKIIHFQGKSSEKKIPKAISNQLISKIKYFKIHHSTFERFLLTSAIIFISIIKMLFFLFFLPLSKKYRGKIIGYKRVIVSIIFNN